ncbi:Hypothetical protein D9617_41g062760 [Elsinoe fawcettii]|nr:Hypothetical protein D9617_41g062760 [Elsinoe fawcettii]
MAPLLPVLDVTDDQGIFRLPMEIRHHIYGYLTMEELIISPVPGTDIASVSTRPPTTSILTTSKSVAADVFSYFMNKSLWCINVQYAFNFFRADPDLNGLVSWPFISYLRKVHLVVTITRSLMQDYPSLTLTDYCKELQDRLSKVCSALSSAKQLDMVSITFNDGSLKNAPIAKAQIFNDLRRLPQQTMIHARSLTSVDIPSNLVSTRYETPQPPDTPLDIPQKRFLHFIHGHGDHNLAARLRREQA